MLREFSCDSIQQMKRLFLLILPAVLLFSASCSHYNDPYYVTGTKEQKKELSQLSRMLQGQSDTPESNFIVIQEIIKILQTEDELEKLNLFLTTYVEQNSEDPFNAYYLMVVAQNYLKRGAHPFAVLYFERILKNYTDILVHGTSVHYTCLSNLIDMVDDPYVRVNYFKELLARFKDAISPGPAYFHLAKTYEKLGEWDLAIQAYKNFMKYPDAKVPGYPEAREEIKPIIDFYDYRNKNWTMAHLDDLVKAIKSAIYRRDARRLAKYMSRVNFFAISWEQEKTKANDEFLTQLSVFMRQRVRYAAELDRDSNTKEAYLKTWGWSYRIRTWYLYFKRVYFPADPEIHGQWEWAGIYFGDKPFSGAK